MLMKPALRRFVFTAHVTSTVGWIGIVAAYVAIAIALLVSTDAQTVRGAYFAMKVIAYFVIIPFTLASLLTGIVQSLGSTWGLFRHWWVIYKLLLTVAATLVLLEYTREMTESAGLAARKSLSGADLDLLRGPLHLIHAGGGLLVLLVAQVLAIYKPRGVTRYGRRKQHQQRTARGSTIVG
jgi:uncharacterized membrane protein